MEQMPLIETANKVAHGPLGDTHTIALLDEVQATGAVEYAFVVVVFENEAEEPCLFVTSEVNAMAEEFGGGSHFLGVFDSLGHANLGDADDWADPKKFFPKAITIAADRLGLALRKGWPETL